MCKVKYLAIIGGLAWGLLVGMSSQAQAQANGFAAVTTRNLTNAVVRYAFWWGDNDGVVPPITTLGPGQSWYQIFDVGAVKVSSSGQSGIEIEVEGMPRPYEVKRLIDQGRLTSPGFVK